jgi:AcrR family transcriptional regulator
MVETPERQRTRGELILLTAMEHFAERGIKGASLREIARAAGTSLTLINHHFDRKANLVNAAIDALHELSAEPAAALRQRLAGQAGLDVDRIVHAWVQYADDLFASRSRMLYLRLLLRLQSESGLDETARAHLDDSAPIVRRALRQVFEEADTASLDAAWLAASHAMYGALLHWAAASPAGEWQLQRRLLEQFLVAGLRAGLAEAKQASAA